MLSQGLNGLRLKRESTWVTKLRGLIIQLKLYKVRLSLTYFFGSRGHLDLSIERLSVRSEAERGQILYFEIDRSCS